MILEVLTLLAIWLLWWSFKTYQNLKDMPPGPLPLPFIGNCFQMRFGMIRAHEILHEKYGDIYTLSLPHMQMVVLNSGKLMREALVTKGEDTAARDQDLIYPMHEVYNGTGLVVIDYGQKYIFRRKVFKTAMHLYGAVGIAKAEKRVNNAIEELLAIIKNKNSTPFVLGPHIRFGIISRVWQWLSSKECSINDATINSLDEFLEKIVGVVTLGQLAQFVPFFRHFSKNFNGYLKDINNLKESIFQKELEEHLNEHNMGDNQDLIHSFISGYKKELEKETRKRDIGSIDDIKGLMMDAFVASTDTSIATISWFFLYMILYPEVQRKIQEELDDVVGREQFPRWRDAENLRYLQAVIFEVIRHSSVVSFVPRTAARDIVMAGYKIPKGTTIYCNNYLVNKNPEQWPQPTLFNPERFLDAEGKFINFQDFLPFGGGTRKCPGEMTGKIQVFTFVSCLLQRFEFHASKDGVKPSLQPKYEYMAIYYPTDYEVVVVNRE